MTYIQVPSVVPLGNVSGVITLDLSQGVAFTYTKVGNLTIGFTNWPTSPLLGEPVLFENEGTGGFSTTITGAALLPPINTAAGVVNVIPLSSPDQGAHIYGVGAPAGLQQSDYDAILPWTVSVEPFLAASDAATKTGTWVVGGTTAQPKGGYLFNTTDVQNDAIGWDVTLAAGTWNLSLMYSKGANYGIATVALDGVTIGTIDQYASAQGYGFLTTLTGIAVATNGKHRLTLTATTRNASSTGWYLTANALQLRRTA